MAMTKEHSDIVRRKDLTFWERFYILQILKGLVVTIAEMFKPKFTIEYPEERFVQTPSFRGRPILVAENGVERCVACGLCSRVCPPLAIDVQAAETPLNKERYPERFEINMLRCIFCGFCEEVCPEEAIIMSQDYELAFENPKDAIFGKDKLIVPIEKVQDRLNFLRNNR
jgi:NADH-quinone oxidoreductase subunit I